MDPLTAGCLVISSVGAAGLRARTSGVLGASFCFVYHHKYQSNSAALDAGTKDLLMLCVGNWTQRNCLMDMTDEINSRHLSR
jgi:hypothetical protein